VCEVRGLNTRRTAWAFAAIVIAIIAAVIGVTLESTSRSNDSASLQSRVLSIASRLRVPNEHDTMTVANSPEPLAQHMRYEIQQDLLKNQTPSEIIRDMQAKYGTGVLAAPRLAGVGQLVWWLPILVLLVLCASLIWFLRTKRDKTDTSPSGEAVVADSEAAQVVKRMHDFL
jgi:cytochrome c-type biogenesis protein CcmH/NrfF